MLMDMIVVAGTVVATSFGAKWYNEYSEKDDPRTEFNHDLVGNMVIDLMYRQAMIWTGAVLSPVLCGWGSLMNLAIFQVQRLCFLRTHKPPEKAWGASDSNKFFLYLLMLTLGIAALPAGVFLDRKMECGPFLGKVSPVGALSDFIGNIKQLKDGMTVLTNPFVLVSVSVVLVIALRFRGTDNNILQRRLEQTSGEWMREKDEKEMLMRRCLEAGMSKEDLDKGKKDKDVDKEMDSDVD